ncbi:hypothetical protein [Sphingopyxis yananensis]|uniref:hypothetical protein n=1 Tax=Sphingopyxis yananensis TaxID=2886687 RepID=UPI001D10A714|nr:hypothetical protein [Sphingopyxis yananensis]MCC2601695.1 hypothetical protein [Sphingopyxis yananensis]
MGVERKAGARGMVGSAGLKCDTPPTGADASQRHGAGVVGDRVAVRRGVVGRRSAAGRGTAKVSSRPNKRQMVAFLDALAESSNITASARAAGLPSNSFYRERRRNADFAAQWHDALCEGFVRLEAELLADALVQPSALVKDATLKARAQKYRLGLALLAAHRAAVRGIGRRTGRGADHGAWRHDVAAGVAAPSGQARQRLAEKLRNVQARARVDGAEQALGSGAGEGACDDLMGDLSGDLGARPSGALGGISSDHGMGSLGDSVGDGVLSVADQAGEDAAEPSGLGWDDAL